MNKKVLHILIDINYSGAEIMLYEASKLFRQNGLELVALSTDHKVGNFADELGDVGYKIVHIPFSKSINHFVQVYKLIKKEKIDILHIHTERAFFYYALIGRLANVNTIVRTVHNIFPFRGALRVRRFFQRIISKKLLGLKFVAIGDSVAEVEKITYNNKAEIIKNWTNPEKFYPAATAADKQLIRQNLKLPLIATIITSVGRCSEVKNHKAILIAISKINHDLRKNLLYVHLGNGHLHEEEQKFAEELGIADNVVFAGQKLNMRDWLVASDIYLMPSFYEGLSIALMEAMSCGLPSVAYNVYGIKDLIDNGVNGFLVDQTPEALLEGLLKLLTDEELREKFGHNAQMAIRENFNMEKSVSKFLRVYQMTK